MKEFRLCIKICPNPSCEAIYHNIPKNITKCEDCGGNIIEINEQTYKKKFSENWFQYDFQKKNKNGTLEYYRSEKN